jgi:DNA invertase Pin-like site-specific DNA recombinase
MTPTPSLRAAVYARVSTFHQEPENQLQELRRYVAARGWESAVEYVDHGVSGAKDFRPALDRLLKDARRRKFDVVVTSKLDRLGRNLKHLITLLDDLQALGVAFVSLGEGIDATTPAGRLQMHVLGAIAEFERGRTVERVRAGLARVKAQGKRLGCQPYAITHAQFEALADRSLPDAAQVLGVSRSVVHRWRLSRNPLESGDGFACRPAAPPWAQMPQRRQAEDDLKAKSLVVETSVGQWEDPGLRGLCLARPASARR